MSVVKVVNTIFEAHNFICEELSPNSRLAVYFTDDHKTFCEIWVLPDGNFVLVEFVPSTSEYIVHGGVSFLYTLTYVNQYKSLLKHEVQPW